MGKERMEWISVKQNVVTKLQWVDIQQVKTAVERLMMMQEKNQRLQTQINYHSLKEKLVSPPYYPREPL